MNLITSYVALQMVPGGITQARVDALANVPETAQLKVCGDEKTGRRFGQAKCRAGKCLKIGSGGRNKGQKSYQIWAVWE